MTPNVIPALDSQMDEVANFSPTPATRFLRFGPFQVDQQREEVTRNGVRLKLQGKVYQVLVALLQKPGEVVTREELRQRLWPADTHVNYDANVNTTVNKLRQVLGDSTDNPIYIETIPRKGYCLVVQPEASDVPANPAQNAFQETAAAPVALAGPEEALPTRRSGFWMPLGVVGLLLVGMLLGVGVTMTTLWFFHFAQTSRWP